MFSMWLNVSGETMTEKMKGYDRNARRTAQGINTPRLRALRTVHTIPDATAPCKPG
jgi:hypothetical protein